MKTWAVMTLLAASATLLAAPQRHPQYEPADPNGSAKPVEQNLFTGAKVTASGFWDKQRPELVIDGKFSDPSQHWACESLPVWIQIDMGTPKELSVLRVWPYWPDGRIYKYKMEGSVDGQTWSMLADMSANSIASTAAGQIFSFPAQQVRYVKMTVLENSRGAKAGGHVVEIQGFNSPISSDPIRLISVTIDERFAQNAIVPAEAPSVIEGTGWHGERFNAQVLVNAKENVEALSAEVYGVDGMPIPNAVYFVRYTLAENRLTADILDDATVLPLSSGMNRPLWLTLDLPRTGDEFKAVLRVRAGKSVSSLPIHIKLEKGLLPAPKDWKVHLDLWMHPDAVARFHDVKLWSDEHFALMKPLGARLGQMGQKSITCTLIDEAWGGQTYDHFSGMIIPQRHPNGSWTYDYTIFDRYVEMMHSVGVKSQIDCYTMIPWNLQFPYLDLATGSWERPKLNPGSAEYEAFWKPYLQDFVRHLNQKGWLKSTKIAMDERPDHMMRPAMALVQKYAPELAVVSAFDRPTKLTESIEVLSISIQHCSSITPEILKFRQNKHYKTTFYTCCAPRKPNTFTVSTPAESTWLGHFAAAQNLDGYLRWAYNSWVENPFVSTDFVTWTTGDCFLVYPGNRSSIRLELLRDGLEDYEKIRILREKAAKSNKPAVKKALNELNDSLSSRYTWVRGEKLSDYSEDVRITKDLISKLTQLLD